MLYLICDVTLKQLLVICASLAIGNAIEPVPSPVAPEPLQEHALAHVQPAIDVAKSPFGIRFPGVLAAMV
ncbi:hypothetical protein GCM10009105_20500 [Dokdonella soli]|uniref:Uncharacterized protein n=1 Tax=Dokdonella soli TaxID=529810 RepID=A0ABN1IJ81_9GAMM